MDLNLDSLITTPSEVKVEKKEDIVFRHENIGFTLPLRTSEFSSEKEHIKFVKNVETAVRRSNEYHYWTSYITDALGHTTCSLTKESMHECSVEIHHHPITLYNICVAVIQDCMNKQEKFCSFDIATKIIELHFQDRVGYIPLLSSLHEKYHNSFLDLPIELVNGSYKYLLENLPFLDDERNRINSLCNIKIENCRQLWSRNNYVTPQLAKE
jgi:hypothetical protein